MGRRIVERVGGLAFSLVVPWLCSHPAAFCLQSPTGTSELAGRIVNVAIVNAVDLSPVNSAGEDLTLVAEEFQLGPGANVYRLLLGNGIAPDSEAFALVYDLNPALRDLRSPRPGSKIQLPRFANNSVLAKVHKDGSLALLTLDPEIRTALNRNAEKLQQTAGSFAQLSAGRYPAQSPSPAEQVTALKNWYGEIRRSFLRRTGPALRRESLLQLEREAEDLDSLLQAALSRSGKLREPDLKRITAIHDDVLLEMTNYGQELATEPPKADALYRVVVNITGAGLKSMERIRVYYTNYGLFHEPPGKQCDAFRTPGSGASELMRVQNYMIWAAQDGDPSHPVTEPLRVKIRPWDGEPIQVTLNSRRSQH